MQTQIARTKGHILLAGGAEFGGRMAEPDRRAIELAGGFDAPVCIIPAAAAPDNNHQRAGQTGVKWFKELGAKNVTLLPLIDRTTANQANMAAELIRFQLIYLLGGFPQYLEQTLEGSLGWHAILEAYHSGAVLGGSSAGAMVLCQYYYDPHTKTILPGLNIVPQACIIPHHERAGTVWMSRIKALLPEGAVIIGIDEQTGMIDEGESGQWQSFGKGAITIYRGSATEIHNTGKAFFL